MVPMSMALAAALDQHDEYLPKPLIPRSTLRGYFGLTTVPQQHPESYTMGPSQVTFCFIVEPPTIF